jgi:hypothetical protein
LAREPRAGEPISASTVAAPSTVDVSAAAIERLRSNIPRTERARVEAAPVADLEEVPLSPHGAASQSRATAPRRDTALTEPRVSAQDRTPAAATEALKASRLDFLFRSKAPPAGQPPAQNFDAFWSTEARQSREVPALQEPQAPPGAEPVERQPDAAAIPERQPESAAAEAPRPASILKSGVVDGMAYTLYADGSIEAKLPQGTVRFGSIAELRAHIENNT